MARSTKPSSTFEISLKLHGTVKSLDDIKAFADLLKDGVAEFKGLGATGVQPELNVWSN